MKRRKKIKKNIKILFIGLLMVLLIGIFLLNKPKSIQISSDIERLLSKYNIGKDKYSKTLEFVLLNGIYEEKYLDMYKDIKFVNRDNFETILTTFLPKGYNAEEINLILNLSDKNIEKLKIKNKIDITSFADYKNFNVDNITRYQEYKNNNTSMSMQDVITQVNLNLDLPVYTNTVEVANGDDLLVLVNKYNHLPQKYAPKDLVYLDGAYGNQVPVRSIIKDSFLKLQEAAKNEIKIDLKPTTAYRGEDFQRTLYNNYVAKDGVTAADTYSARPGYSEHQTGLSIDLRNTALSSDIRLTEDNFNWLNNNCYKYGFIIRFPQNKEKITGYQFENWHIRYVGTEAAKTIHEQNLTLEEYVDLYIREY